MVAYTPDTGCVRSELVAQREHTVKIDALDLDVRFRKGEPIHTESSYKFSPEEIAAIAGDCGLTLRHTWTDPEERFGVNLLLR